MTIMIKMIPGKTAGIAAVAVLYLAGASAAGLAAENLCNQTQSSLAVKPSPPAASAGAVTGQVPAPKAGLLPQRQLPQAVQPGITGAANPAYSLNREAGSIRFGDGRTGSRPTAGNNATGTGKAGNIEGNPCK